ncbi:MAG: hypothetical protein AB2719_19690 [Candidatus Thiodiazotropha sp.]|nr:hypothetical protein [Candidatus Thiodiazotropha sp. (ex Codakia orbicularis)]
MKKSFSVIFCSLFLILSLNSWAEFSNQLLPDLGNLAKLVAEADKSKIEKEVYDVNGRFSSNLPAPDSAGGRTAEQLAHMLSSGSEPLRQRLIAAFLGNRDRFLKNLTDSNYAVNDMGVAYAASFILLWELASNRELSRLASEQAASFLIHAFSKMNGEYAKIGLDERAMAYDWLTTIPVVMTSLVMAFEKDGRQREVVMLREKSASLFLNAFKVPHNMLSISESGVISMDVDKVVAYQQRYGIGGIR